MSSLGGSSRAVCVFEGVEERGERGLDDVARAADRRPPPRSLAGIDEHARRRRGAGSAIEDAPLVLVQADAAQAWELRAQGLSERGVECVHRTIARGGRVINGAVDLNLDR